MLKMKLILLFILHFFLFVESKRVLFLHIQASFSHRVVTWPLAKALVEKGYEVTYVTSFPPWNQSTEIQEIHPAKLSKYITDEIQKYYTLEKRVAGKPPEFLFTNDIIINSCEILLSDPVFLEWISSHQKADLIYIDSYAECGYGLAYKLDSTLAVFSTLPMSPRYVEQFGIPEESGRIPYWEQPFEVPLGFWGRSISVALPLLHEISYKFKKSRWDEMFWEKLNISKQVPVSDLMRNRVALVMSNSGGIDEFPRSLPPHFISVPGIHIKKKLELLPKEIKSFVDSPTFEAIVYVSLGTMVQDTALPETTFDNFVTAFEAFPKVGFVWKYDGKKLPIHKPQNILFVSWTPQQEILAHEKTKAFIGQCGRPSTQEAIYYGVPVISLPVSGDQDYNANRLVNLGVSIKLEIRNITTEVLRDSIQEILENKLIHEKMKNVSAKFRDIDVDSLKKALFWTEYMMRHDDFSHLRPFGSVSEFWYQRRNLDVWLFYIFIFNVIIFSVVLVTYSSLKKLLFLVTSRQTPASQKLKRT